ncbi:MAG: hypothetical protein O3A84_03460 [Proteobacteria bacterium]|nr:hypothetical protein [Pseudomonadota bacterium]
MRLNEIYQNYKDQMNFLLIYTREAHPDDGWRVPQNLEAGITYREPTSDEEREAVATACQINLDLKMPMLIDSIDNDVERKYVSLPMRLFLIDKDGGIVYTGDEGPRGFDTNSWEAAIKAQIT